MVKHSTILLLFFVLLNVCLCYGDVPASSFSNIGVMPLETLKKATEVAKKGIVSSGYCGRGVWSVLSSIGYGEGLHSANGQDWESVLYTAGWRPFFCLSPLQAPFGSVLVYCSDLRRFGQNLVGTLGGDYGHVELVSINDSRKRVYVSDSPRLKPGGSVPFNFTRRAWLPPDSFARQVVTSLRISSYNPVSFSKDSSSLLEDRLSLALQVLSPISTNPPYNQAVGALVDN